MRYRLLEMVAVIVLLSAQLLAQQAYVPSKGTWERRTPQQLDLDPAKLKEAVDFAVSSESKAPRDLELAHYQSFGREPFGDAIGRFKERGDATGLIIRNGYIVAEWGDLERVDMTFSVTKALLPQRSAWPLTANLSKISKTRSPITIRR